MENGVAFGSASQSVDFEIGLEDDGEVVEREGAVLVGSFGYSVRSDVPFHRAWEK